MSIRLPEDAPTDRLRDDALFLGLNALFEYYAEEDNHLYEIQWRRNYIESTLPRVYEAPLEIQQARMLRHLNYLQAQVESRTRWAIMHRQEAWSSGLLQGFIVQVVLCARNQRYGDAFVAVLAAYNSQQSEHNRHLYFYPYNWVAYNVNELPTL